MSNTLKPFPGTELRALGDHFALVGKVLGNTRANHWTGWAELLAQAVVIHEAIDSYAQHKYECELQYGELCSCGLDALRGILRNIEGEPVAHDAPAQRAD